jgi:uncharacterized membrane protein YphA (DoxX/SURF4 family)
MPAAPRTDIGLLVLRLVLGVTFLLHGLDKLGDVHGVQQGFDQMGFMSPTSWRRS